MLIVLLHILVCYESDSQLVCVLHVIGSLCVLYLLFISTSV